jgi:hypothetical protein
VQLHHDLMVEGADLADTGSLRLKPQPDQIHQVLGRLR